VHAINRELPPPNEQFIVDFEQLQSQFPVSFFFLALLFISCFVLSDVKACKDGIVDLWHDWIELFELIYYIMFGLTYLSLSTVIMFGLTHLSLSTDMNTCETVWENW